MNFYIPDFVLTAILLLNEEGYECYLVGGCVRDFLRGAAPHDFDLTTNATPDQMMRVFCEYRTIKTGICHGTLTVLVDGTPLEITTYRLDGAYTDHRRPDSVCFTTSLAEDLSRRDFTVNAMAYHPKTGLVDLFGGERDLSDGVIRAVGKPERRFCEDALRILRALRFAARFGFSIEEETAIAAGMAAPMLKEIAPERIREELCGILTAEYTYDILSRYGDIVREVIPEGKWGACLASLPPKRELRLAEFLLDQGEMGAKEVLRRLRADNRMISDVGAIIRLFSVETPKTHADFCRLMRHNTIEILDLAFALRAVHGKADGDVMESMEQIRNRGECYRISDLAVDGNDILRLGAAGARVGFLLEAAYDAVVERRVPNEKAALIEFLSTMEKQ